MSTQAQRLRETADILPQDVYSWLHPIMTESAFEIERLRAALRPFAEVARGDRLNPTPDEWQRASAVYTNTSANEQTAKCVDCGTPLDASEICPGCGSYQPSAKR